MTSGQALGLMFDNLHVSVCILVIAVVWHFTDLQLSRNTLYLLGPRLCLFIVLNRDFFVYHDD